MSPPVLARRASGDLAGAVGADVLAVPVAHGPDGPEPRSGTADAVVASGADLAAVCDAARFTGRAGSTLLVPVDASRAARGLPPQLLLVGTGSATPLDLRRAGAALARAARGRERVATTVLARTGAAGVRAFCEGLLLASWTPPSSGLAEPPPPPVRVVDLLGVPDDLVAAGAPAPALPAPSDQAPADDAVPTSAPAADADAVLARAALVAAAVLEARDAVATPPDVATPRWVAERAVAAARELPALEVEVLSADDLAARGAGALLAVGRAAGAPPRLVLARYTPPAAAPSSAAPSTAAPPTAAPSSAAPSSATPSTAEGGPVPREHVVLVGGGTTFDTGGLALRPRTAMATTGAHLAGAAAALAVVTALAREGTHPGPVTAVLPLVENALGGDAHRPGDVVRTAAGTTVEVTDPAAAGLLVLADALALAEVDLAPDVLVDLGAVSAAAPLALGRRHAALFTDDDDLAASLEAAAAATGERVWRMPLVEDLLPSLDSALADLRQPSAGAVRAGAVGAALFLREFAGGRRWAHLDVSGPLRSPRDDHELAKGATGYGTALLLEWLAVRAAGGPGGPGPADPPT